MPTNRLPNSANMDHLKSQAKDLLRAFRANHMAALQRVREFHPKFRDIKDADMAECTFSLSDAQLCIAREYGYASWPRLKAVIADRRHEELQLTHNDRLPNGPFKQALDFMDAGEEQRLKDHLARHPDLVHETVVFEGENYFSNPTLLEFIPENPIRQGRLPRNAVEIAKTLLEAGAKENPRAINEALMLAASGRVCREHNIQTPLLQLLSTYGADPTDALYSALAHKEFEAARVLVANGAPLSLSTAAALNDIDAVKRLLKTDGEDQIQLALALAANAGRTEVVKLLLEAGADPNSYNPPGGHSHSTPLHSAVANDQFDTVVALVQGGARLDIKDIHHKVTALGWAEHLKRDEIAKYLKQNE